MNASVRAQARHHGLDTFLLGLAIVPLGFTFQVDSLTDAPDVNPGDQACDAGVTGGAGRCTLRAAVMESNVASGIDTIEVPSGIYNLDPNLGPLIITSEVKIQGAAASRPILDGMNGTLRTRLIHVSGGGYLVANHLIIQNGFSQVGGGIAVDEGTAELNDLMIRDNGSFTGGGGVIISSKGTVKMWRSTIFHNRGGAFGGGILNQGTLWVFDSTIANNDSNRSGGIRNEGEMHLRNTTISGNTAHSTLAGTGGISQVGYAQLSNVTIVNNTGAGNSAVGNRGGGIQTSSGRVTVLKNSIIAGNDGGGGPNDCDGPLSPESAYNLIGDRNGCGIPSGMEHTFRLNLDPQLNALNNNGGPTQTHLPTAKSPVLNAGFPSTSTPSMDDCELRDQRGVPRLGYGACDIGAVEVTRADFAVAGFVLVNAVTDQDIRPLRHGDTVVLSDVVPELSVRAVMMGSPDGVIFGYDGNPSVHEDIGAPFSLGGDVAGNYAQAPIAEGHHTLSATPFKVDGMDKIGGVSQVIDFTVLNTRGAADKWEIGRIEIEKPADNLILTAPTIPKLIVSAKHYSDLKVSLKEGTSTETDATDRMVSLGSDRWTTDLNLPIGMHRVTAGAVLSCWYCTGGKKWVTDSHTFTILPAAASCTRTDGNRVRTIPSEGVLAGQIPGKQHIMTPLQNGDFMLIILDDAPGLQQNQMRVEVDINPNNDVTWNKAVEAWGACRSGSQRVDLAEASYTPAGGFGVGVICPPLSAANDFRSSCTTSGTMLINQSTTGELLLRKPGYFGVWYDVEVFDSSIWSAWGGRSVRFVWWTD